MLRLFISLTVLSCVCACRPPAGPALPGPMASLQGDWLVLYPKHYLDNDAQKAAYVKAQDSIAGLLGLKIISFRADGSFVQADSLFRSTGHWSMPADEVVLIDKGGKGLDRFKGEYNGVYHDTLRITEYIPLDSQKIKVVWHLKRLSEKQQKMLASEKGNWWRRLPAAPETRAEIRLRLTAMLSYYACYFYMVSAESAYFKGDRLCLPFKYYQHWVQLQPFNTDGWFASFFFDKEQAAEAYAMLSQAVKKSQEKRFPSGKDFVIEYAMYFERLAEIAAKE